MMHLKPKAPSKIPLFIGIGIGAFFLLIILYSLGFMQNLNFLMSDSLYGGKTPINSIVIVAIDDKSIDKIGRWPWDRSVFASLNSKLQGSLTIGYDIGFYENATGDAAFTSSLAGNKVVLASQVNGFDADGKADSYLLPKTEFLDAGARTGYVNILTHPDGVTRTADLTVSTQYDHFAYTILESALGIRREKEAMLYINFPSVPYMYQMVSIADVVAGKVDSSVFKNKIVLVGATSQSLKDHYFVPTSSGVAMPGVEVHAAIIQTLLNSNHLHHQSDASLFILLFLFVVGAGVCVFFLRPVWTFGILTGVIVLYEFCAIFFFDQNIILNLVYPPLAIMLAYPLFYAGSYAIETRERKKVESAFGKYLSPVVVSHLLKNKESVELGGVEKELTIFFSDIRGFTTLSEKLSPSELVATLNEYFDAMSTIVITHNGIVDKYIGDAIMAFWGAPNVNEKHARDAVLSALAMKKEMKKIKARFAVRGIDIDIGMGINTGQVIVGNIGSHSRFDYTVIGDAVNLASRVEGLTKEYGVLLLITAHTKRHLDNSFVCRELDLVAVKGKTEPVALFEVVGMLEDVEYDTTEFISIYSRGLTLYRQGEFADAKAKFTESYAMKHDKASKLMMVRCEEYLVHPPADWMGVYVAKNK